VGSKTMISFQYIFSSVLTILLLVVFLITSVKSAENDRPEILRLMVWEGYTPERIVNEFEQEIEEKYNKKVELEIVYASGSDDFFGSVRNKNVDMITISHHWIKDARFGYISKELILPIDLDNIPNYHNMISEYRDADFHLSDGKIYGVPVAHGPYGLVYNTETFQTAPQSWEIFWDPAYKKNYAIGRHEYLYNINITALALGYPRETLNKFDGLNNRVFKEKLRELAVHARILWTGVDKVEDLLGLDIATSWGDSLKALKRKGQVWKMANPREGTLWWVDEYAITWSLAGRPFMKKVAEEWINKSLSGDFQLDHLVRELGIFPVVSNIRDDLSAEEKDRIMPDSDRSIMGNRILQQMYTQRDRNGMKLLWEEALRQRNTTGKDF